MMFLLKQRHQYGKQLVGQLVAFPIVVVPDLLILQVEIIVFIWERWFSKLFTWLRNKCFSFIASATHCSFDAICHYLRLKILFINGNDVALETACPIGKIIGRSAYIRSDGCCT